MLTLQLIKNCSYPDSAIFLFMDADDLLIHTFVVPSVFILYHHGEGYKALINAHRLNEHIGTSALEIIAVAIKGMTMGVPPAPTMSRIIRDTNSLSILNLTCLLGTAKLNFARICVENRKYCRLTLLTLPGIRFPSILIDSSLTQPSILPRSVNEN
uniref:Uncharacterized protein n=1 Tax=Laticauda laticaudata TaxID=8630 RepID=A0A8C5SXX2_LATLA